MLISPPSPSAVQAAREHLDQARRGAGQGDEWPTEAPPLLRRIGVVGAGTMGSGIAMSCLAAGLPTVLLDQSAEALARGMARIRASQDNAVQRGRLEAGERERRLALLDGSTAWADLSGCDLVIEAVFEHTAIKQEVLARLHAVCPPGTVLASNTSTLDIDALAAASGRPAQVLGLHFLTPAHIVPLVEVVRGAQTSAAALVLARTLVQRIGKRPVQTGNAWGFIGNRMFEGYLREVDALLLAGVPAARVDAALEGFGFALGPCRTLDMAGLDIVAQVLVEREKRFPGTQPPAYRRVTRRLAELGRLGHKSGRGYYRYEGRQPVPDPDLAALCAEEAARLGIPQTPDLDDAAIVRRCVQPLIDEGRELLREGVARRASDIDLVWVDGYGFPADRGGPMHFAGLSQARPVVPLAVA